MLRTRILVAVLLALPLAAIADDHDKGETTLAERILAELIASNTAPSGGNDLRPAMALIEKHLRTAGFGDDEITVIESGEKLPNLVVRYRSAKPQRGPVLMMAHIDVVEALPEDWSVPPFEMTRADGYYYGRGTTDNKAGGAILVANLVRLRKEGYAPDRDLIVMLTADEESSGDGALKIATEHRDLIAADFALNTDAGYVFEVDGGPPAFLMQTAEKVYVSYRLEAKDPGGHSSVPRADSAISRIARTLAALNEHRFPVSLNETTRTFFSRWGGYAPAGEQALIEALVRGAPDADVSVALDAAPLYNAMARTTCIATMIEGGHAENAIPQTATATVNCRVLPQYDTDTALGAIQSMADLNDVTVEQIDVARPSPPSPLRSDVVAAVTATAGEFWPGTVLIPVMSTGATDGLYVRNAEIPVYGVAGIMKDPNDIRAHGQDERIGVQAFRDADAFWYRLIKRVSSPD